MLEELTSLPDTSEIRHSALRDLDLANTETSFQEEALRYFKEAVQLKETLPEDRLQSIYLIGELSRRLGRFDEAKLWFEKATENPMPQRWAREILKNQKRVLEREMAEARSAH